MIFQSLQLSGHAPLEYSQVGRKHVSYHPAKSGLLNGTPDKSSGQQIKLPNLCRIPEVLPGVPFKTPIILTLTLHSSVSFSAFSG